MERRQELWWHVEAVEFAKSEWACWLNNRRLFEPIGNVSPIGCEQEYYRLHEVPAVLTGGM